MTDNIVQNRNFTRQFCFFGRENTCSTKGWGVVSIFIHHLNFKLPHKWILCLHHLHNNLTAAGVKQVISRKKNPKTLLVLRSKKLKKCFDEKFCKLICFAHQCTHVHMTISRKNCQCKNTFYKQKIQHDVSRNFYTKCRGFVGAVLRFILLWWFSK